MKVLFLPNFRVRAMLTDNPAVAPPNKMLSKTNYWFFRHFENAEVDVVDNRAPFPFGLVAKILRIEFFQAFRALVRLRDYDVVVSHSFNSAFMLAFLRSLLATKSPPHVVIDVGSLNGGRENPLQIALIQRALRSVAGLIHHSRVNEKFYARFFGDTRRIFIPLGIDPEEWRPISDPGPEEYALSIGQVFRDYGTLIRAWAKIDLPLTIVGAVSVDAKGLSNVKMIPRVTPDVLKSIMGRARFIVLPIANVRYSIGQTTLLHCMAMEKPIIVSRSHGVIDYCEDGVNCLTFECGNEGELIEKVASLRQDPSLAGTIARNARRDATSKFNEKAMALQIEMFILELVTRPADASL